MDRTAKIAIGVAIALFVAWQFYFAAHQPPAPPLSQKTAALPSSAQASGSPTAVPSVTQPKATQKTQAEQSAEEKTEAISSASANYVFTNLGGGIGKAVLLNHVAEQGEKVTLGAADAIPLGAINFQPGEDGKAACSVNADRVGGVVTCQRTLDQGEVSKTFT